MSITLTPADSKQAREKLKLSQAKAAKEAGINRAYLCQFENGSRILNDSTLDQLHQYYISQGWGEDNLNLIEDEFAIQEGLIRVCDGFVIPNTIEVEVADNLLSEYHQNSEEIAKCKNLSKGLSLDWTKKRHR